jgi:hypothetical protein
MSSAATHESSIMERLVWSPDKAEAILSIAFSPEDIERMRHLMDRNNEGTLSQEERAEMDDFRRVGTFLAILQARARLFLESGNAPTCSG